MQTKRHIGLLGGSFNPAHAGHLHISLEAIKRLRLDEIWWLVSPQNPLKQAGDLADYALRLKTARGVARHPRIRVLDLEQQRGLRYTIDTVRYLTAHHPRTRFVWLMGADNLAGFHRWRAWRAIAQALPIAILDRAPYGLRALHARFATRFARTRIHSRHAALLRGLPTPCWAYLTIPRHPLSASHLRKTLGKNAFFRHTAQE
ncbi:MAG: nicotinate-nucleotide adenylyltransferase [Alphaproteobacteria bacterium]|nr:nicotinate-nucleotide adenylyltransferase [Alphaproteobacteria bacterium]